MDDLAARLADQTSWTLFLAGVIGMIALVLALSAGESRVNTEARWGIANPGGQWEERLIAEANPPKPNLREPRPVGFRR